MSASLNRMYYFSDGVGKTQDVTTISGVPMIGCNRRLSSIVAENVNCSKYCLARYHQIQYLWPIVVHVS